MNLAERQIGKNARFSENACKKCANLYSFNSIAIPLISSQHRLNHRWPGASVAGLNNIERMTLTLRGYSADFPVGKMRTMAFVTSETVFHISYTGLCGVKLSETATSHVYKARPLLSRRLWLHGSTQ